MDVFNRVVSPQATFEGTFLRLLLFTLMAIFLMAITPFHSGNVAIVADSIVLYQS